MQNYFLKKTVFILLTSVSFSFFAQSPGGVSSNLSLWLKADNPLSITGSPVQAWKTSGGSAINFSITQASASNRPAFINGATSYTKYNYNPRIDFTNTSSTRLFNTATTPDLLGGNGTAIIVTTQEGITGFTYYTGSTGRYQLKPDFRFQTGLGGTGYTFDWGAPTEYSSTSAAMICSYGCATTAALRKNSVQVVAPNNTAPLYNPAVSTGLYMGANNSSEYSSNSVAEVILFNAKPTVAEMDRIETYLAIKYGITRGGNAGTTALYNYIASDGTTVIWNKVLNAGYNADIAGIGRDDNSGLNQKQSISVNNGEALTISVGPTLIPSENSVNATSFTSNTSFLIWGNNALAKTFNTGATKPAGIVERLDRVWKLQSTNFSQQATIGFESAQIAGLGTIGTLCLLFDDDGNFSNATVIAACTATNTGSRVEFSGITIPAALPYMTLARVQLPTFASNNAPICEGNTLSLSAELVGGNTYSWTGPNTFTASVQNPSIATVSSSASGMYSVTVNSYGCITNFTTSAVINPTVIPSAIISTGSSTICAGANVAFTSSITNGGGAPSYQWQVNGTNSGTGSTFNSSTLNNGDVVTLILTSNALCASPASVNSNSVTITVGSMVTPSVSNTVSSNSICVGSMASFTATPTNGGTSPGYQWQVNGINTGTGQTFSSSSLSTGDVVSVVMNSNLSCTSPTTATSNSVTMVVTNTVTPAVSNTVSSSTICAGTSVSFTATPTNGGSSPAYQWQVNGVNVGIGSVFSSTSLNNGDQVSVVLTSNANCVVPASANSNSVTMTVNPNITPNVTNAASTTTICAGTNVSFTATPTNGGTLPSYQWQVNGTNAGTGQTFSSSTLNNGDVVSVVLTSNAVCASPTAANSNSITIIVTNTVVPSVLCSSSTNTICTGTTVSFTATPTNGGSAPAFQWLLNGVSAGTGSTYSSASLSNGDVISVVLTSNQLCATPASANSNSITMVVANAVVPSVVNAASANTICAGTNVSFTATPTNGGTTPAYQWMVNGINAGTGPVFSSSTLNSGDVVSVILTSNATCVSPASASSNTITMIVTNTVVPSIVSVASATNICSGNAVNFTATPVNGGSTPNYQWQVNGINVGTDSPFFSSSSLNDGDVVSLTFTSNIACAVPATANSNIITMSVTPNPSAAFSYSPTDPTVDNSNVNFSNQSTNSTSVLWTFENGSNSSNQNPSYNFPGAGVYTVTLFASNGNCTSMITQTIIVSDVETYYIPNTFTPNGDGVNEFFNVIGTGISTEGFEMNIYNRWGQIVFSSDSQLKGWDGKTTNGSDAPDGVYVYLVKFKFNSKKDVISKVGDIYLFR